MKNKFGYIVTIFMLLGVVACNNATKDKDQTENEKKTDTFMFPKLKDRTGALAQASDWSGVQAKAAEYYQKIEADSLDLKPQLQLAQLYMQEARITGEHPYYYPATLKILNNVLQHDKNNFGAMAFKSSVLLSLHHFGEALNTGTQARMVNSNNGFIFGVLCDANVELGNYDEAVRMSDQMQKLRPGLESYSRASYLREIYGNNANAIEAMKLAFQAGLPGSEEASWAGNTLAQLYENSGDLDHAEETSKIVLAQRPSYAFATNSLGRIEMARGNYDKAIALFDEAARVMPEFSFYENKAEAYERKGDAAKAKEIYTQVLGMLKEDSVSGHYADMDMALVYVKLGNYNNALASAEREYKRRPANIDVNSTMAWVLYKKGNYAEAKKHITTAMRMGTQNAVLLARAGLIETAMGNAKAGSDYTAKAGKINPYLSQELIRKSS